MFNFVDMLELKDLTDDILALFVSLHKLEYIKQLGGGGVHHHDSKGKCNINQSNDI